MNTLDFKLYVGGKGKVVDRSQLATIPTPLPVDRWHPIPHSTLVEEFEKSLVPHNMKISNEVFKLDKKGQRLFALMQISNCKNDEDFSFVAGLRNSHDKAVSAGLAVGEGVFVCSNLRFSGEITIGRKHTTSIMDDLPAMISGAVGRLALDWDVQAKHVSIYKSKDIGKLEGRNLLVECAKKNVFPRTQLMDVINEFENPRHMEFKDRNLWSLMNSVTQSLQPRESSSGSTLWLLPSRTTKLNQICNEFAGIPAINV
jgi:hypothetical protein